MRKFHEGGECSATGFLPREPRILQFHEPVKMTMNRRRLQRDASGGIGKSAEYYESRCRDKEKILLVWSLLAMNVLSAKGLNLDGIALLEFKKSIQDPSNFTGNWDTSDASPCHWQGVGCLSIPGLGEQRVVTVSLAR